MMAPCVVAPFIRIGFHKALQNRNLSLLPVRLNLKYICILKTKLAKMRHWLSTNNCGFRE